MSLGSNSGDRILNISKALNFLKNDVFFNSKCKVSSVYLSKAVLPKAGSLVFWNVGFYNICISGLTTLPVRELLKATQKVESKIGRLKTRFRWSPRKIDIDLIYYSNQSIRVRGLVVPHKLMHARAFVLGPLSEIEPNFLHPKTGARNITMFQTLPLNAIRSISRSSKLSNIL